MGRSHKQENKAYIKAMLDLRRSNAAQPHKTAKAKGTRRERKAKHIREQLENGD